MRFYKIVALVLALVASAIVTGAFAESESGQNPHVALETSRGTVVLELYPDKAPQTVENFLAYVKSGHYDGVIFHRVIPDFMIQGGGFTPDMKEKPVGSPIRNEADNGLLNQRGTVAMARTQAPHSATAQFFINVRDNAFLNYRAQNSGGWGYAVFGRVVEGMNVVDAISSVTTGAKGAFRDVPLQPVIIEKALMQ